MERILLFGNSGSGKSTLAKAISEQRTIPSLDLDTVAWKNTWPPVRRDHSESASTIDRFAAENQFWVIEGCYSSLISCCFRYATQAVFLNPGIEVCIENCRARPWEPHKYESKEDQDKNLDMLINWVRDYETREDEFSLFEHRKLFEAFKGRKQELRSNKETRDFLQRF